MSDLLSGFIDPYPTTVPNLPILCQFETNLLIYKLQMKEGLRKLKGTGIATELGQITLGENFREEDCEYDQLYFSTDRDSITVKVYDLEKEESAERFRHQTEAYGRQAYEELAEPLLIKEIQIKKNPFGIIALKICKSFTLKETASTFSHHEWLSLIEFVVGFIEKLRQQKQVYLNFHPANISRNSFGEFKITDPEFLTNQGSFADLSSAQEELIDLCEKQYLYRAPQLLDQYTKGKIDYKSDLYSFAIVLYEMLYHQYPFESKLAQISCNYRPFPEESFFSSFISKLLRPYHQRESLQNLKTMIEAQRKKVPKEANIKSLNSGSTAQSKSGGIFAGLTQMFSKLTTQTQSWYLNFTENDDSIPEEKYLNLLVSKLYKKQAKIQKLHLVMMKYLDQGEIPQNQSRFIKTLLLMIQLFRRGPNFINYQWEEIIQLIETKCSSHAVILELCNFIKAKLALNTKFKVLFRGNFYIEDLSRFKLVTVEVLEGLQSYLSFVIESIKSKFLFIKKQKPVIDYAKQLYCDEILDLISIITLSVICIRKDNELKLRKDPLEKIKEIEKKINIQLQKISYLSNHVNAHPIYSLQAQYLYYQEEFQVRESPFYTSLEYFYKNVREYKGLSVPQNYSLNYASNDHKQFLSNENHRSEKSAEYAHKNYFIDDEEEYENETSNKAIEPPSPEKVKLKEKILQQLKQKPKRQMKPNKQINIFDLKPKTNSETKEQTSKKTVKFQEFFKVQAKPAAFPQDQPKNLFFNFDKKDLSKPIKKNDDFSFFDNFLEDKTKNMKEIQNKDKKVQQNFNNFFENFGAIKEKQVKPKEKSALSSSSSQKIIQQSLLNGKGLKKSVFPVVSSPQKAKCSVDPELLNNIITGLKLKQLKQMIVNNQQIIIDFKSLKLQKVIGSGSAGEVYVGKYNNETLAIKKVKTKENPNALKEFERELVTYIKIKRHPYLVSLVGLSRSVQDYYLLTEFCNSGSLFDLLHKRANTVPLSWKQRIMLATQVARGMAALHDMKPSIIHRDLKSLNVFVTEEKGLYTAKVADFGLSRSPEAEMMTMYLGTLHWMAPELLDNKQYSSKVDVYSFAVVLWQICSRKTPYNELSSPMAIIKHVTIENKRPNLSLIPPDCPPQLIEIMKSSWAYQPNERPTFNTIIDRLSKITMIF